MSKLPIFEWFISRGDVLISVNTLIEGVDMPSHLRGQEIVDFILGVNPTPRMSAGADGIDASMRFAGKFFNCHFPWDSIIQMSGKDAVIQFRAPEVKKGEPHKAASHRKPDFEKRPKLRIVK